MFDGAPDQFHQFITPRTSSLPLHHLPFPLHASGTPNTTTFPPNFDPYNPSHHQLPLQHNNNNNNLLHHPLHHKHHEHKEENTTVSSMNFEIQQRGHQSQQQLLDPWTNDEVLALLRIRSSMESWFPELTWEHVSRKLAELGYKRSAEKCKEKFEEESRFFNNNINYAKNNSNNNNYNNNYRVLSELEQLYQGGGDHQVGPEDKAQELQKEDSKMGLEEEDSRNEEVVEKTMERKRKRPDRFEMFKGFCESIVHNMMAQQEEMHKKLIEDMVKRDEEKFTREEAWKKQEMDKMNKELEMMTREQAIAGDRQNNIIEILKKFSTTSPASQTLNPNPNNVIPSSGDNTFHPTPSSPLQINPILTENPSSSLAQETLQQVPHHQNPSSSSLETNSAMNNKASSNYVSTTSINEKDDVGRRWPKDEVLALINLRCNSVNNNNNNNEEKEGNKAPLWERISQGMMELGYKRSAKRCKEKWENINKYFRKTKDSNKKRSLDSRTCPYFHLLSNLYNQGKLVTQSESHLNNNPPEQVPPDESSSQVGSGGFSTLQQEEQEQVDHGGEKTLMQVPSLDFDDQF